MVTIREVKSDEKKIIDEIVTIHLNTPYFYGAWFFKTDVSVIL